MILFRWTGRCTILMTAVFNQPPVPIVNQQPSIVPNHYQYESAITIDNPHDSEPCTELDLDALVPLFRGLSLNKRVTACSNLRKPFFVESLSIWVYNRDWQSMCGIGSGWPGKLLPSSSAGMNIPYIMQHGSIASKTWLKKSVSFSFICCELGGSGPFGFFTQGLLVQTLWLCYLWPISWCLILRQQFPMQVTHQSDNKGLHCINQKTGGGRSTASQYHNINRCCALRHNLIAGWHWIPKKQEAVFSHGRRVRMLLKLNCQLGINQT